MRPTIPALTAWTPSAVVGGSATVATAAASLEAAADQLMRDIDALSGTWSGAAADAARERVSAERRTLVAVADAWTAAARALDTGCTALSSLRSQVLNLIVEAQGASLFVDPRGKAHARCAGLDLMAWVARLRAAREYTEAIGGVLTAIDQTDYDMGLAVAAAAGGAADPAGLLAGAPQLGEGGGEPGGEAFVIGPPTRPDLTWDEDFVYDSEDAGPGDYLAATEWKTKMAGARILRSDLDDALDAYGHYWDNNGELFEIDYEEAYREDESIRANVDSELARATAGAERLIAAGNVDFSMTGDAAPSPSYPVTENWQKTVGGYQQWSSADVVVAGGTVTMTVTVHAEDYYNFNSGQADIASEAPDDANGRFTEVGWAKPFPTSGQVVRTMTWPVGSPELATEVVAPIESGR